MKNEEVSQGGLHVSVGVEDACSTRKAFNAFAVTDVHHICTSANECGGVCRVFKTCVFTILYYTLLIEYMKNY